jgi:predicted N-acetyltransferase YhbS
MAVNTGSRRVMEKAGLRFVRAFHLDWPVYVPGGEAGDVEYAITKQEWERAVSGETYSIRAAEPADAPAVRDVYRRSSLSNDGDRANLLAHPHELHFDDGPIIERRTRVAIDGQRVVGFVTTRSHCDTVELDDLFVDPDWMRRGIGRSLVVDAVGFARSLGVARIEVTANPHAWAFYSATGFVLDGVTETHFGPGHRMHLDVAP